MVLPVQKGTCNINTSQNLYANWLTGLSRMNQKGESWRGINGLGPCNSRRSAGLLMRPLTQVQQGDLAESPKCLVAFQDTDKRDHLKLTGKALSPFVTVNSLLT